MTGRRFVVVHTDADETPTHTHVLGSVIYADRAAAEHRAAERTAMAAAHDWTSTYEVHELVPVQPNITDLIEASSLGTPDAVAMRNRTTDAEARRVVARAREIGEERQ